MVSVIRSVGFSSALHKISGDRVSPPARVNNIDALGNELCIESWVSECALVLLALKFQCQNVYICFCLLRKLNVSMLALSLKFVRRILH